METIIQKKTVDDYRELGEGASYELIEGSLVKEPSPLYEHQRSLMKLSNLIYNFVEQNDLGEVLVAPMDVYLDNENVFQPDILFIAKENLSLIEKDGIHGAPDLVIEILSPSNKNNDLIIKFRNYERHGVREYFIVDPGSKEVIACSLTEGRFREVYRKPGIVISQILNEEFHF